MRMSAQPLELLRALGTAFPLPPADAGSMVVHVRLLELSFWNPPWDVNPRQFRVPSHSVVPGFTRTNPPLGRGAWPQFVGTYCSTMAEKKLGVSRTGSPFPSIRRLR